VAEGFVRVQNVLPQTFGLALILTSDSSVTMIPLNEDQTAEIPISLSPAKGRIWWSLAQRVSLASPPLIKSKFDNRSGMRRSLHGAAHFLMIYKIAIFIMEFMTYNFTFR
jgi:hypothetical protein